MSTFDELKKVWDENQRTVSVPQAYNYDTLEKIIRSRTKKHLNTAMQYFWAAFVLQIVVYALLSHVMIKYGSDMETLLFSMAGILLFLPFTIMLMKKFKQIAVTKLARGNSGTSLYDYVRQQLTHLQNFYKFKRSYELVLIPLSTVIGIFLTFKLYVPGGAAEHLTGAIITFVISIISCGLAIRSENRKSFKQPLRQLNELIDEFKLEG